MDLLTLLIKAPDGNQGSFLVLVFGAFIFLIIAFSLIITSIVLIINLILKKKRTFKYYLLTFIIGLFIGLIISGILCTAI